MARERSRAGGRLDAGPDARALGGGPALRGAGVPLHAHLLHAVELDPERLESGAIDGGDDDVVAGAEQERFARHDLAFVVQEDGVVTRPRPDDVLARPGNDDVVSDGRVDHVVAVVAEHDAVAEAVDHVVPRPPVDHRPLTDGESQTEELANGERRGPDDAGTTVEGGLDGAAAEPRAGRC